MTRARERASEPTGASAITEAVAALTFARRRRRPRRWGFPGEPPAVATAAWLAGPLLRPAPGRVRRRRGPHPTRPARARPDAAAAAARERARCSSPRRSSSAQRPRRSPPAATRRTALLPALADGWFSVAPALVLAIVGMPDGLWAAAGGARPGDLRPDRRRLRRRRAAAAARPRPGRARPAQRLRLGLSRRRAADAGRPCSPPSSGAIIRSSSPPSCRSPACSPSSPASAAAGSRTRSSCTGSSRRASSGCSRSSRTPPT